MDSPISYFISRTGDPWENWWKRGKEENIYLLCQGGTNRKSSPNVIFLASSILACMPLSLFQLSHFYLLFSLQLGAIGKLYWESQSSNIFLFLHIFRLHLHPQKRPKYCHLAALIKNVSSPYGLLPILPVTFKVAQFTVKFYFFSNFSFILDNLFSLICIFTCFHSSYNIFIIRNISLYNLIISYFSSSFSSLFFLTSAIHWPSISRFSKRCLF